MGNSKRPKYGGRQAGTPNKTTKEIREKIDGFINDKFEDFELSWNELSAKDKILLFEKMLSYVMPKMQTASIQLQDDERKINLPDWLNESE